MTSAVAYARVSSKDQEKEGFSIPAQLKLLREYASKNGFEIVREFVDVETAKSAGRQHFGEMVTFLGKNPHCKTVLVEKTDRLYRNLRDYVTIEDLRIDIHLPKEGQIVGPNARSQTKLMHGLNVVIARNYIDNLREEVRKGMREKAEQGIYPSRPPLGYRNNRVDHTIEIDPENAAVVKRIFQLYASGENSLSNVRTKIREEFGRPYPKGYLHKLLRNVFYAGFFVWDGITYRGTQESFIDSNTFQNAQAVLRGHNRPKYRKHRFAFSNLLTCAFDNSTVTAEIKKSKYVYYHCTGYRGKCALPYMREAELGVKLGEILKNIHIPDHIAEQIESTLTAEHNRSNSDRQRHASALKQQLSALQSRMDQAYLDKLDGKITEEFWSRKNSEWQMQETRVRGELDSLNAPPNEQLLSARRILELANKACFLYERQDCAEKAKLLKMVLSNCATDGVSLYPTYRKPFDVIFQRVKSEEWRALRDSNSRPSDS